VTDAIRFLKGHGTENDFVLLPDADGALGRPSPELVRALCDRRSGLGADGVMRVVRTAATDDPDAVAARGQAEWFMDYHNADGSTSEMCGNGIRVFAEHLRREGAVDVTAPLPVATRGGIRTLTWDEGRFTVDMGVPEVADDLTWVAAHGSRWSARTISMGNPHAVAFVDDLAEAGALTEEPDHDRAVYPEGVNVEFVARVGPHHVAMRVHERGSGETRSCGTGACAVMVAAALADGNGPGSTYVVDVPGGRLEVTWTEQGRALLTGPAVLVAEGYWFA
jgi:diaminopimelate epimerase